MRKFILSGDGNVDAGIAQFVRWALRVVAVASIFQVLLMLDICIHVEVTRYWGPKKTRGNNSCGVLVFSRPLIAAQMNDQQIY